MLTLNLNGIKEQASAWEAAGVALPKFDVRNMKAYTMEHPKWIHFGAGNIFRGFIANLMQDLLDSGAEKAGIIAVDTFDFDIIDNIYKPFDDLTLLVHLKADGTMEKKVVAGVAQSLKGCPDMEDYQTLAGYFANPSLSMVSFTITEKGYALRGMDGAYFKAVEEDMKQGPAHPTHVMSITTALLYHRFLHGAAPIAVVSMDNCSHNGEKLRNSVLELAEQWVENKKAEPAFLDYLKAEDKVSFPFTMIDKITPRPAKEVEQELSAKGISDMHPVITGKNTFIAPFVNAETAQYLVVEDKFPAGRPALEQAGVYMTDRDTVNKTETMKVTTCLNPLHTALAVFGCLLGYDSIAAEMKDGDLKALVSGIGYAEGMPVVTSPGILSPKEFIRQVIEERLPNPFIPDMPQRIATDTSLKVGIRFGETLKAYLNTPSLDIHGLTYIPLAIAGWMRYLLGVNDRGEVFEISQDPMLPELQELLKGITLGEPSTYNGNLSRILSNAGIFGLDLCEAGLLPVIEDMFLQMLEGQGAVRKTLSKYVGGAGA